MDKNLQKFGDKLQETGQWLIEIAIQLKALRDAANLQHQITPKRRNVDSVDRLIEYRGYRDLSSRLS